MLGNNTVSSNKTEKSLQQQLAEYMAVPEQSSLVMDLAVNREDLSKKIKKRHRDLNITKDNLPNKKPSVSDGRVIITSPSLDSIVTQGIMKTRDLDEFVDDMDGLDFTAHESGPQMPRKKPRGRQLSL